MAERGAPLPPGRSTCLLVDDLEENLLVLQALLEPLDVEILTARSGAAALDLLLGHDVALVLLDVHMPEMDGFELAELMRGGADPPIPRSSSPPPAARQAYLHRLHLARSTPYNRSTRTCCSARCGCRRRTAKATVACSFTHGPTLRMNETFAAMLGHDLRSPLASVTARTFSCVADDPEAVRGPPAMLASGVRLGG